MTTYEGEATPPYAWTHSPAPRHHLLLLLRDAGGRAGRIAEHALASQSLDTRRYALLALLASAAGPMPQQVIAIRLDRDRTTVMDLIDQLEGANLVQRKRDPTDRRVKLVHLTDNGRRRLHLARSRLDRAERELLGELGREERGRLERRLRALV